MPEVQAHDASPAKSKDSNDQAEPSKPQDEPEMKSDEKS